MDRKRGQTATEYLIILFVVIVIALVVVVAMGQFPGIGEQTGQRGSAAYWSAQDIGIASYAFADDGGRLVLNNNQRNAVAVTNVTIGVASSDDTPITLGPGGSQTVDLGAGNDCPPGQTYSFDVSIEYTDQQTGATYTITGGGQSLEGTCASSLS